MKYLRWNDEQTGTKECGQWTCGFVQKKLVQLSAGKDSEWPTAVDMAARPTAVCRGGDSEVSLIDEIEETEMTGVQEGEDRMPEEEAPDAAEGGAARLACERSSSKQTDAPKEEKSTEQHTCRSEEHALYDP